MAYSALFLEQFVLEAKDLEGAACVELVKRALEAPRVYLFKELLDMPNILELGNVGYKTCLNTLKLFTFGTYSDYLKNKSAYLELTPGQKEKLKQLTFANIGSYQLAVVYCTNPGQCISYSSLLKELEFNNVADLEKFIIDAIRPDIVRGRMDPENKEFEVCYAFKRDAKADHIYFKRKYLEFLEESGNTFDERISTYMNFAKSEQLKSLAKSQIMKWLKIKAENDDDISTTKNVLKALVKDRLDGTGDVMVPKNCEAAADAEIGKKS